MKVKFVPSGQELEIKPNESVLKVAHDNGIHIKSVCKGVPSCAECRIQLADGEYNVIPPSPTELNLIGTAYFVDRSRLACQLKCFGDITVDLSEQIEKASRNLGSKRPRGARLDGDDYDAGASSAIQGSIVLDEKKVFEQIEEVEVKKAEQKEVQREAQRENQRNRQAQQSGRQQQGRSQQQPQHRPQPAKPMQPAQPLQRRVLPTPNKKNDPTEGESES